MDHFSDSVMPAQAGIQSLGPLFPDASLRWHDRPHE